MSTNEYAEFSNSDGSEESGSEDYDSESETEELRCMCDRSPKNQLSRTSKNWLRPFFCCPKPIDRQCGFFKWADEVYEIDCDIPPFDYDSFKKYDNCHWLQTKVYKIRKERDEERAAWNGKKTELETKVSTLQSELDQTKKRIKLADEKEFMPPLDKLSNSDNAVDNEVVVVKNVV